MSREPEVEPDIEVVSISLRVAGIELDTSLAGPTRSRGRGRQGAPRGEVARRRVSQSRAPSEAAQEEAAPAPTPAGEPPVSRSVWPGSDEADFRPLRLLLSSRTRFPKPPRFYAVTGTPQCASWLLGVWHVEWALLEGLLPTTKLAGSGVSLRGFDTEAEAQEHFALKRPRVANSLHDRQEAQERLAGLF